MTVKQCPRCKYIVSITVFYNVKVDSACPRCGKKKLSEFKNYNLPESEEEK